MLIALILESFLLAYFLNRDIRTYLRIRKHLAAYNEQDGKMERIYTDAFGNNWYYYPNPLNIPPNRSMRVEVARRMTVLCMDDAMFDDYLKEIALALSRKDWNRCAYLVGRMEERRRLPAEENTLKALADGYFLLEGENPKECSDYWFEKKKDIWSKDEACKGFFLHRALSMTRDISDLSESDLLRSLTLEAVARSLHQL